MKRITIIIMKLVIKRIKMRIKILLIIMKKIPLTTKKRIF
jgi:hypothetical protein